VNPGPFGQGPIYLCRTHRTQRIQGYRPRGDKEERLISQIDLFMGGSILLPKDAPWLKEFESELLSFPGRHDDQVDALAQGLAWRREAWKAPPPRRTVGMGG
jgi:phage terminase large subunit-like protein